MRYQTSPKKRAANKPRGLTVILTLIACMLVGIAVGAIAGVSGYEAVSGSLAGYLQNFGLDADPWEVMRESSLKYGKLFVIIWLLAFLPSGGFLPVGGLAATLLLIFRGAAYGFSTAVLIRGYGLAGAASAAILYLPQSLILIPAYIFAAYSCVSFAQKTGEIRSYLPVLIGGLAVSLLAGFIDAFVIPGLVRGL
ncbi:MAG: stage II sporulation protein M [Defluviitaleaceae bacterium]|nr:stage II sporulation protein M [Defluviitaleaceae bacterium]